MQTLVIAAVAAAALSVTLAATAEAAQRRAKASSYAIAKRDCTPFNGRYGYYGNPWCDTGSYRMEDIEFRERTVRYRKHYLTR